MSESDEEKTEDPTHKKLEDAKKKGQQATSKEVSNFLMIFVFGLIVMMVLPGSMPSLSDDMKNYFIKSSTFEATPAMLEDVASSMFFDIFGALAVPFLLLIIAAVGSSLLQNGFNISVDPMMPKLDKISLRKGFGRMFSRKSFMEFLKGIIKIIIVGIVAYYAVADDILIVGGTHEYELEDSLALMIDLCSQIIISATIAIFFIAILDFMYQKFEFMKQMRMSKHEIKEEYKQQEGDPKIKGKLKQMRMERARTRMMSAVPTADVIVTNPTHYAIALKYEQISASAPIVVALGVDKVAEKIKEIADENKIPIVRNPTLARALHAECKLDEEIPFEHYQAVAEIISYVYKLKKKK